jgi:hypothetical protein
MVWCVCMSGVWQANGGTPLYAASQNGHVEVVRALVGAGAAVNQARVRDDCGGCWCSVVAAGVRLCVSGMVWSAACKCVAVLARVCFWGVPERFDVCDRMWEVLCAIMVRYVRGSVCLVVGRLMVAPHCLSPVTMVTWRW